MPRTKKPAGTAADARNGRRAELAPTRPAGAPEIDRDQFQPQSLILWDAYWADPAAATQTPADAMMAITWIETYNDYREKKADADRMPMVEGSMGQLVANPLYQVAHQQLTMAMACARQLGIGAKNRADLGITLLAEKQALDDINARYLGPEYAAGTEGSGQNDDDDDPRGPADA